MSLEQETRQGSLRNGKILERATENPPMDSSTMTEINFADAESVGNSDVFSRLVEIRDNYEKKVNDLQSEFSKLMDLMMVVFRNLIPTAKTKTLRVLQSRPNRGSTMGSLQVT